jgi:hypothetical protein
MPTRSGKTTMAAFRAKAIPRRASQRGPDERVETDIFEHVV